MKRMLRYFLAGLLGAVVAVTALAQDKVPVQVVSEVEGKDATGHRFVYAIKNKVAAGYQMKLTEDKSETRIVVSVKTLPVGETDITVFCIVWLVDIPNAPFSFYVESTGGYTGSQGVDKIASEVAYRTNDYIEKLRDYADYLDKLPPAPEPPKPVPPTPEPQKQKPPKYNPGNS